MQTTKPKPERILQKYLIQERTNTSFPLFHLFFSLFFLFLSTISIHSEALEKSNVLPKGSDMRLKNVRFRWIPSIFVEAEKLTLRVIPNKAGGILNFDRPEGFYFYLLNGGAIVPIPVLETIFNKQIFNKDTQPLRNLKFSVVKNDTGNMLRLNGEMKLVGIWLNFEMDTVTSIDTDRNLIELAPVKITALGLGFVKSLLGITPINLELLLPLEKDLPVKIEGNLIFVNAEGLFTKPKITGKLSKAFVNDNGLEVIFSNPYQPVFQNFRSDKHPNMIYIQGGNIQFGKIAINNAKAELRDTSLQNYFDFCISTYFRSLVKGKALINPDQSVSVDIPDFVE